MDSKNSQTTPATTNTTPVRQLLGATDAQTAHPATSSTAPAHQPLGSANAETTTQPAKGTTRRNVTQGVWQSKSARRVLLGVLTGLRFSGGNRLLYLSTDGWAHCFSGCRNRGWMSLCSQVLLLPLGAGGEGGCWVWNASDHLRPPPLRSRAEGSWASGSAPLSRWAQGWGNANPAARNLCHYHGTGEIVPFVNFAFE